MKKLGILLSNTGQGTNLQAIIDAIESKQLNATISVVVSDTLDTQGVVRAKKHNLATIISDAQTDFIKLFTETYPIDYIVLAGWKRIIPDAFIDVFRDRILNLHPGLIPDSINGAVHNPDDTEGLWNKGKLGEVAVQNFLDTQATFGGSSVHFLTHEFDFGPVLGRTFEKINPEDTTETLYTRLKQKENALYVEVLRKLCN